MGGLYAPLGVEDRAAAPSDAKSVQITTGNMSRRVAADAAANSGRRPGATRLSHADPNPHSCISIRLDCERPPPAEEVLGLPKHHIDSDNYK